MSRPTLEVADIFRAHADNFIDKHTVAFQQLKVIRAITRCRTAALGGHNDRHPCNTDYNIDDHTNHDVDNTDRLDFECCSCCTAFPQRLEKRNLKTSLVVRLPWIRLAFPNRQAAFAFADEFCAVLLRTVRGQEWVLGKHVDGLTRGMVTELVSNAAFPVPPSRSETRPPQDTNAVIRPQELRE